MKHKLLALLGVVILLAASLTVVPAGASGGETHQRIPMDIDPRLKGVPAPAQRSPAEAAELVALGETQESQCFGNGDTLVITITSFDPANPGSQDVVFFRETPEESEGKATLWVAWDFMTTAYGEEHVITCDQLADLQEQMDRIVDTDVHYFGQYVQRPEGNENIDVMIYNIVDESYFDPEFPSYVAGFFWSGINETFDRNMVFIDTYDWENRLGPDVTHPYLYEGTVAHELEHLIHNDHDPNELSWVDEGLADLSEFLNGFGHPASHVVYYLAFHRTSLTNWGGGLEDYGASYLFQLYLLENFGSKTNGTDYVWDNAWTLGLVDEELNSIAGIEAQTGASMNDLYDAWILANHLDDHNLLGAGGFPLGYEEITLTPFESAAYTPWSIARSITDIYADPHSVDLPIDRFYSHGDGDRSSNAAPPYAPFYTTYGMEPQMNIWLRGEVASGVAPYSGDYEVASGGGNMVSDRMLALNVPVGGTLTFWAWYDIEEEWDYGFVEASTDGGQTWTPLPGSITAYSENPNDSTAWKNSLLGEADSTDAAITGNSGGWVEGIFDLPAASDVLVRFSYYTDEAMNGAGWFIDDVSVDGFSDSFEDETDDWDLGGWTRTTGLYENDWVVAYVNPVYVDGEFSSLDYEYLDDGEVLDSYEYTNATVETSLNGDLATVVISNRPQESPFNGDFLLLVKKGKTDNK